MNSVLDKPYVVWVEAEADKADAKLTGSIHGKPWEFVRVPDTQTTLEVLQQHEVAVVVVYCGRDRDTWEPFLAQLKSYDVMVIRLGLTPKTAQVNDSLVEIHQFLSAQCGPEALIAAIDRGFQVWTWLQANPMLDALMAEIRYLPSLPSLYFALRQEIDSPSSNLHRIVELLGRDASLVARLLRIANSGFYARPRQITNIQEAVGLLGLDLVLGIVLSAHLFDSLPLPGLKPEFLWKHNFAVAKVAQRFSKIQGDPPELINASGLAGLLHDIGSLVLLANLPGSYPALLRKSQSDEGQLIHLERQHWGAGHPDIGAMVLKLWNISDPVVEAVALHHDLGEETFQQANPVPQAVFVAELLVGGYAAYGPQAIATLESEYPFVSAPKWREACVPLLSAADQ